MYLDVILVYGESCSASLFSLLQKVEAFLWTEEFHTAFMSLQRAFVEPPSVSPTDPALHFVLNTDASSVGTGTVLAQVMPSGRCLHPSCCCYCKSAHSNPKDCAVAVHIYSF